MQRYGGDGRFPACVISRFTYITPVSLQLVVQFQHIPARDFKSAAIGGNCTFFPRPGNHQGEEADQLQEGHDFPAARDAPVVCCAAIWGK